MNNRFSNMLNYLGQFQLIVKIFTQRNTFGFTCTKSLKLAIANVVKVVKPCSFCGLELKYIWWYAKTWKNECHKNFFTGYLHFLWILWGSILFFQYFTDFISVDLTLNYKLEKWQYKFLKFWKDAEWRAKKNENFAIKLKKELFLVAGCCFLLAVWHFVVIFLAILVLLALCFVEVSSLLPYFIITIFWDLIGK